MVNEWEQNINTLWADEATNPTYYNAISVEYPAHGFNALTQNTTYTGDSWLDCATDGTWWSALATMVVHKEGIPGLNSIVAEKVELWALINGSPVPEL